MNRTPLSGLVKSESLVRRTLWNEVVAVDIFELPVAAAFAQAGIDDLLNLLRLPGSTPLSVLAVELFNKESLVIREDGFHAEIGNLPEGATPPMLGTAAAQPATPGSAVAAAAAAATQVSPQSEVINDPLGQELGAQRILRVSPLTPVRAVC